MISVSSFTTIIRIERVITGILREQLGSSLPTKHTLGFVGYFQTRRDSENPIETTAKLSKFGRGTTLFGDR